jgi:DNA gyrase subunit A
LEKIKDYQDILANETRVFQIIKDEHKEIKDKYGDERRTEIGNPVEAVDMEDLIAEEQIAIILSKKGFIKRMPITLFRSQLRGGRGVSGMTTREEDIIDQMFICSTHDHVLCFTTNGRVFRSKAYQFPEASRQSKGVSVSHFFNLEEGENITTAIPLKTFDQDGNLFMTTQNGVVKKTEIKAFKNVKNRSIIAINLDSGDRLNWVKVTNGNQDIILVTSAAMVIRFDEKDVRAVGRDTRGVRGIKIKKDDRLMSMDVIDPEEENMHLLLITANGFGKNLKVSEFKRQKRGGIGVMSLRFRKTVAGDCIRDAVISTKEHEIMIVTLKGTLCRQKIASISTQRRTSQGVKIMKLDQDDEVTSMALVVAEDKKETEE